MNGKQAKRLRNAARHVYVTKVVPALKEAQAAGKFEEAAMKLPTPLSLYKDVKRRYKRGK